MPTLSKKEYDRIYYLKNRTKKCAIANAYHLANKNIPSYKKKIRRYYLKNRETFLKRSKDWKINRLLIDPSYREIMRQQARETYKKHKIRYQIYNFKKRHTKKRLARVALGCAIKSHKIQRPTHCECCKKICTPDGHHYLGYDYPLKVMWLCRVCHCAVHM